MNKLPDYEAEKLKRIENERMRAETEGLDLVGAVGRDRVARAILRGEIKPLDLSACPLFKKALSE